MKIFKIYLVLPFVAAALVSASVLAAVVPVPVPYKNTTEQKKETKLKQIIIEEIKDKQVIKRTNNKALIQLPNKNIAEQKKKADLKQIVIGETKNKQVIKGINNKTTVSVSGKNIVEQKNITNLKQMATGKIINKHIVKGASNKTIASITGKNIAEQKKEIITKRKVSSEPTNEPFIRDIYNKPIEISKKSVLKETNNTSNVDLKITNPIAGQQTEIIKAETHNISNINLNITSQEKPSIKVSEPPKKIDNEIFVSDQEKIQHAFEIQKKMDIDDITILWESTVERNSVIKFALRKLAMPADQRRIHSSLMAKSVSALISGASILPSFFGVDSLASSATMAGGSLASRVVDAKAFPKELPLTDTELIQLASLVESLQDKLIKNYYDYKSSIEALKVCRQNLLLQNKNYSDALQAGNQLSIIAASALYDKDLINELRIKQQIKQYRLELERLAGTDAVDKLTLTKVASLNYKGIDVNNSVQLTKNEDNNKEINK